MAARRFAKNVSPYYLNLEIRQSWDGLEVAIASDAWHRIREQSPEQFATTLHKIARHVNLARYQKHKRGPKKRPPQKNQYKNGGHVSTARLLAEQKSP